MKHTLAAALAIIAMTAPVNAQTEPPLIEEAELSPISMRADQVVALLNGDIAIPLEDVFTPQFLAAVSPDQLVALSQQLTGQFGAALAVEKLEPSDGTQSAIEVRMEKAIAKGNIAIDPAQNNRIGGLVFQTFEPINDSAEKIQADLDALPGTTNALLAKIGADGSVDPLFAHNPSQQLALGSTFKLYVLSALARSVDAGERRWSDIVPLTEKSLPSGMMQDWPVGAPVTLQTLATLMISISDNTATDQLISVVGRDAIEAELIASGNSDPSKSIPFLKTRQLFEMRGATEEVTARYLAGDDDAQRVIIDNLSEGDFSMERTEQVFAAGTPGAIEIEWYASPEDLAKLMRRMRSHQSSEALSVMAVSPQLSGEMLAKWEYAGFKGGSEPGVLNLTWLLTDKAGDDWILTLGWNNPDAAVETASLQALSQRLFALVP
ncbi:serine hydrolase [Erythrobacter sp. MTPC3]|uniref:serine hydrolase n=1 Tax=Erythrobacter sp. MTPC3 TaxID=3056564 RepID=UPI0036F3A641